MNLNDSILIPKLKKMLNQTPPERDMTSLK